MSLLADLIQQKTTINFLSVLLEYIGTNKNCDEDFIKETLNKAFESKGEHIMYSLVDKWKIDAKKEGKNEGRKEGKTELLSFLFEERFGKVPQQIKKQINKADDKLIEDLARSILKFQSINECYLWLDKNFAKI